MLWQREIMLNRIYLTFNQEFDRPKIGKSTRKWLDDVFAMIFLWFLQCNFYTLWTASWLKTEGEHFLLQYIEHGKAWWIHLSKSIFIHRITCLFETVAAWPIKLFRLWRSNYHILKTTGLWRTVLHQITRLAIWPITSWWPHFF